MTIYEMRAYFLSKGVSQLEVARFIGVHARTVGAWFSGKVEPPQLFLMAIEADIFGVEKPPGKRTSKRLVLRKVQ